MFAFMMKSSLKYAADAKTSRIRVSNSENSLLSNLLNKILTSNILNNWENSAQIDQINWLFDMQYGPI